MRYIFFSFFVLFLIGCGEPEGRLSYFHQPKKITPDDTFYIQLKDDIKNTKASIYIIDGFNYSKDDISKLKKAKKLVMCYFSGGILHSDDKDVDSYDEDVKGKTVSLYDDSRYLDIRANQVLNNMKKRVDFAKSKGCDGVVFADMQNYEEDTGFNISSQNQIDYNSELAKYLEDESMYRGIRGDENQSKDMWFRYGFIVVDNAYERNITDKLDYYYNNKKAIFNIETDIKYLTDKEEFKKLCDFSRKNHIKSVVLSKSLDGSIIKSCDY